MLLNVIGIKIFGVDNSLLFHADNCKNNFLVLGEGDTFGINENVGAPGKKFNINFSKENTKLCMNLHYNGDNSYLFVNRKKSINLKLILKILTFRLSFV